MYASIISTTSHMSNMIIFYNRVFVLLHDRETAEWTRNENTEMAAELCPDLSS